MVSSCLRTVAKRILLTLLVAGLFSSRPLQGQLVGDPFSGYTDSTSYFLDYSDGNFDKGNSKDVKIDASIDGGATYQSYDVDTGSRGFYISSDELPADFLANATGTYTGEIDLTSSGKVSVGVWVPTTVDLQVHPVINGTVSTAMVTVPSSTRLLDVTTLAAEPTSGKPAFYGTYTTTGSVQLVDGGSVPILKDTDPKSADYGSYGITLSGTLEVTYAANQGILKGGANFGIGFDLGGAGGTGNSVGDNKNQIYNPLINIAGMTNTGTSTATIVAGYVITPDGIQLGLSTPTGSLTAGNALNDKGYAYTKLNPTIYTSNNSQPDWQTPLGQTEVKGVVNGPGSVVLDSGIGNAYISAPGLTDADLTGTIPISLMNSGFQVGYKIDESDPNNDLNPSKLTVSLGGTTGLYSQNKDPYGYQYFNSGRNVFEAFNMLYDAQDGYMGLLPTEYGASLETANGGNGDVFFSAIAGGFPDPIPEPAGSTTAMALAGFILSAIRLFRNSQKKARNRSVVAAAPRRDGPFSIRPIRPI